MLYNYISISIYLYYISYIYYYIIIYLIISKKSEINFHINLQVLYYCTIDYISKIFYLKIILRK